MKQEVILGEIVSPHGIKGYVNVVSHAESTKSFKRTETVCVRYRDGEDLTYRVEDVNGRGKKVIIKFFGVDTRENAETLVGSTILVNRKELPDTDDGEYYWYDLIDMEVCDTTGKYLGVIKKIFQTGSNDVYVVQGEKG
jgi:16S rRNA processing protein RimM